MPRKKRDRNALAAYYNAHKNCEWCGFYNNKAVEAVEVHHIVYRSHLGGEAPENLISLCRECHWKVHGGIIKREDLMKIKEAR